MEHSSLYATNKRELGYFWLFEAFIKTAIAHFFLEWQQ